MVLLENAAPIDEGASSCFVIDDDEPIFYKTDANGLVELIKRMENPISALILSIIPFKRHISQARKRKRLVEKEVRTWQLWKQAGIEVPKLIAYDNKGISYRFIEGSVSYRALLENGGSPEAFDAFLELYERIRRTAKIERNPDFLHSDPYLQNFLYADGKAIPIDAELMLNPRMSFEELDACLLVDTLISIDELRVGNEKIREHIKAFRQILSDEDVERVTSIDYTIPAYVKAYFAFREEFAHRLKGREKKEPLQELVKFVRDYKSFIEGILIE